MSASHSAATPPQEMDTMGSDEAFQADLSPAIVCGLSNIGNTCYFNSGIQCLANVPAFIVALRWTLPRTKAVEDRMRRIRRTNTPARHMLWSLIDVYDQMENGSAVRFAPMTLLKSVQAANPQFEGFEQQDAAELVNTFLSRVDDETTLSMNLEELLRKSVDAGVVPLSRHSQRQAEVFRFFNAVNSENAQREKQACERANKPFQFVPPSLSRSPIGDMFQGLRVSEITCSHCGAVSRVVDPFMSIEAEIPTPKQRAQYAAQKRKAAAAKAAASEQVAKPRSMFPCGWLTACFAGLAGCFQWLFSCCFGPSAPSTPITLQECLEIHCMEEKLRGGNKYRCDHCGNLVIAHKRSRFLELPEILIVHLKRFEFGYWTSKISDYVDFPMNWEKGPYQPGAAYNDTDNFDQASPSATSQPSTAFSVPNSSALTDQALDLRSLCIDNVQAPITSTYTLNSVINHHGSFNGGHYTAFAHKPKYGWVLCNDDKVSRVSGGSVVDSQAYVLFYQKQRPGADTPTSDLTPQSGEGDNLVPPSVPQLRRVAAGYLLDTTLLNRGDDICYISRMWLHRMVYYEEPGMIFNAMCYCEEGKRDRCLYNEKALPADYPADAPRHFHYPAESFYAPIRASDWEGFQRVYGGGPKVTATEYEGLVRDEAKFIQATQSRPVA